MENRPNNPESETAQGTPGSILRRCREFQKMTLEDAANSTKIGKNYLRALEEDRPGNLPSPAYLKGFLRIYATHLGLNSDDILRMLEKEANADAEQNLLHEKSLSHEEPGRSTWHRYLLPAVLLAATIVAALILSPRKDLRETTTSAKIPGAETAVESIQKPVSSSIAATGQKPPENESPIDASTARSLQPVAPAGIIVKMKTNKSGQIKVVIDGSNSQAYELNAGDIIEWKADRSLTFELSDAGIAEMELNGKPSRMPVQAGRPAILTIDSEGMKSQQ